MQIPLQLTFRNVPRSEALETRIREKVAHMEEKHPRVSRCRVTVEELDRHHHQGKQFRVVIDLHALGQEIVVNHHQNEDVYVALRDSFEAAVRRIRDLERVAHDREKHPRRHASEQARLNAALVESSAEPQTGDRKPASGEEGKRAPDEGGAA